ncbi:MAG TPA: hypothetical protein VMB78_03645 [Dissulfurispiraceae bacterium]|nr:hypothetical protein [Dissulfurispiraceae bacterium]
MNIFEQVLENPRRMKKVRRIFYICLAFIVLGEVAVVYLLHAGHGHFFFEEFPAWGSFYGLISCVLIIVVSKWIGHAFLMKKEDYYDD